MPFGFSTGFQQAVQSIVTTVGQLAGQAVSMLSLTLTQTTGNVALQMTTGARAKLGSGTNDFFTSDGANTITAAGILAAASSLISSGGVVRVTDGNSNPGAYSGTNLGLNSNLLGIRGDVANGASAICTAFGNVTAQTTAGGQISAWYSDNFATKVLAVDISGRLLNPSPGNSTGSPGNATLNTASGRCSMNAGAGATLVITNNLISTTTIPFVTIMTADATMTAVKNAVPTANTLTITFNAASTGTVTIGWLIFNV